MHTNKTTSEKFNVGFSALLRVYYNIEVFNSCKYSLTVPNSLTMKNTLVFSSEFALVVLGTNVVYLFISFYIIITIFLLFFYLYVYIYLITCVRFYNY